MSNQLLLRRRAMMAGGEPAVDVVATLNISDITNPTTVFSQPDMFEYEMDYMVIDGRKIQNTGTYQFDSTGIHTVGYKCKNFEGNPVGYFPFSDAFGGNTDFPLVSLYIGDTITVINSYSMSSCGYTNGLSGFSASLPDTITSIETMAFRWSNLANINIPNACTVIGDYVFTNCRNLIAKVLPVTPPNIGEAVFPSSVTIYVSYSSDHSILAAYQSASGWSSYAANIHELNPDGTIPT